MPMSPALVAMIRIVKARMATQMPDQNASTWDTLPKWVTIPATGSSFHVVASSLKYMWCCASKCTGKTLMPMVGRIAETASTATMTPKYARGTLRPGFFASSLRLEMVSMPVYVTIAREMLARKLPHVGATPQWMLLMTTCQLSRNTTPRMTRANWVTRSTMAKKMLMKLDSWMPRMFSTISRPVSVTAASACGTGCWKLWNRGTYLPNTLRQEMAVYAEMDTVAAKLSSCIQPTKKPIGSLNARRAKLELPPACGRAAVPSA